MSTRWYQWPGRLCLFAAGGAGLFGQSAQVSLGTQSTQPDGTVMVAVVLSTAGVPLSAIQLDVIYDNSVASLTAVAGQSASDASKTLYVGNLPGLQERFLLADLNQNSVADGEIIDLVLTPSTGASGPYRLSLSNVVAAGPDGSAIAISVSGGATPPVIQPITFSVLNGASLQSGSVAPGEIVTLFGAGLLPAGGAPSDVGVTFNGVSAPLLYAGPNQINAIVPFAVAGQTSARIAITYIGQETGSVTTAVAAVAPAVFTVNSSGKGQALILNQDLTPNSASQPAARGSTVTLYATGAGSMNPPLQDGQIVPAGTPSVPASPITVRFDGAVYAAITYAGPAPGLVAGVLQVNFVVPTNLSPGSTVPFFTLAGSVQAPFVTMAVQ